MSNGDLFYVFGIALAVSAGGTALFGLRSQKFPGRAFPLVILWFAVLVGAATVFAVLHSKDEEKAKAAALSKAGRQITEEERGAASAVPALPSPPPGPGATGSAPAGR